MVNIKFWRDFGSSQISVFLCSTWSVQCNTSIYRTGWSRPFPGYNCNITFQGTSLADFWYQAQELCSTLLRKGHKVVYRRQSWILSGQKQFHPDATMNASYYIFWWTAHATLIKFIQEWLMSIGVHSQTQSTGKRFKSKTVHVTYRSDTTRAFFGLYTFFIRNLLYRAASYIVCELDLHRANYE